MCKNIGEGIKFAKFEKKIVVAKSIYDWFVLLRLHRSIENMTLDVTLSITNVYNRKNVFYVNTFNEVVYQLPILPSLSLAFGW